MLQARALSLAAQVAVMYEPHFAGQIARKFARNISDVPDLPETTGKVFSQLLEDRDSNHLSGYVEKDVRHAVKLAGVFAPSAPAEEEELELIPFAMFNGLIRMRSRVISMLYAPHIQAEMLKLKDDLRGYIIQELKPGAKTRSSAKAK
jgi:hypothetical protein